MAVRETHVDAVVAVVVIVGVAGGDGYHGIWKLSLAVAVAVHGLQLQSCVRLAMLQAAVRLESIFVLDLRGTVSGCGHHSRWS